MSVPSVYLVLPVLFDLLTPVLPLRKVAHNGIKLLGVLTSLMDGSWGLGLPVVVSGLGRRLAGCRLSKHAVLIVGASSGTRQTQSLCPLCSPGSPLPHVPSFPPSDSLSSVFPCAVFAMCQLCHVHRQDKVCCTWTVQRQPAIYENPNGHSLRLPILPFMACCESAGYMSQSQQYFSSQ